MFEAQRNLAAIASPRSLLMAAVTLVSALFVSMLLATPSASAQGRYDYDRGYDRGYDGPSVCGDGYRACYRQSRQADSSYRHRSERRHDNRSRGASNTPQLLGMIAGGLLGSELRGGKKRKRAGAIFGALLGGSIARDMSGGRQGEQRYEPARYQRYRDQRYRDASRRGTIDLRDLQWREPRYRW